MEQDQSSVMLSNIASALMTGICRTPKMRIECLTWKQGELKTFSSKWSQFYWVHFYSWGIFKNALVNQITCITEIATKSANWFGKLSLFCCMDKYWDTGGEGLGSFSFLCFSERICKRKLVGTQKYLYFAWELIQLYIIVFFVRYRLWSCLRKSLLTKLTRKDKIIALLKQTIKHNCLGYILALDGNVILKIPMYWKICLTERKEGKRLSAAAGYHVIFLVSRLQCKDPKGALNKLSPDLVTARPCKHSMKPELVCSDTSARLCNVQLHGFQ